MTAVGDARRRVYLDFNATTPPLPEVARAMTAAMSEAWANPSSIHGDGRRARKVVEEARAKIGALVSRDPRDVVLTGSGTEANNLALRARFSDTAVPGEEREPRDTGDGAREPHVLITSRLEHPSITKVAEQLEREGRARVRWLAVSRDGVIDLADLASALASEPRARLVALQAVNQEHGAVQPVREACALAAARGVPVHVDAVQAWGRLALGDALAGADTLSLAAHKLRGPKGIGALATNPGKKLVPVLLGGAQERGLRPGTVDAALAAGFGVAAEHARGAHADYAKLAPKRDAFEAELAKRGLVVVAKNAPRAPHVTCVIVPGWTSAELVASLDLEGVSASSGSACSAGTLEPSPVLEATLGADAAARGLRISMGPDTNDDELAFALGALDRVLARGPLA